MDRALEAISLGRGVVVVDDDARENEGDVLFAAELISPESLNFMITHARGIVCVPLPPDHLDALLIPEMVEREADLDAAAFTVTVDLADSGSSGTSVHDRVACIRHLMSTTAEPVDFSRPGHVMPLRAHRHGLVGRRGHTEAAVELTALAGLRPGGVICEILNPDGSMARGAGLEEFARRADMPLISVEQIASERFGFTGAVAEASS